MSGARFDRFITGVFVKRARTCLDRFLCVRQFESDEPYASIGWLNGVALFMPLVIHMVITNGTGNSLDMPELVFTCASLQYLSISLITKVKTIIRSVSINLPYLTFLELTGLELHDDFAQNLFMGCPSLARLKLSSCDLHFFSIPSEVLKELTLINCCLHEQMQISCPDLVSLSMAIYLKRGGISLNNMSSLVNAVINLCQYLGDDVPVLNLFGGLSNAAKLEICLDTPMLKEQLEKDIPNCRNFDNLKKLVVGGKWNMSYDFYLIACLLKHSPNLKELGLMLDESLCLMQKPQQEVSGDVLFQHEYLETVKIYDLYGTIGELSVELFTAMMKTLNSYIKKIGNWVIF
ncbi:F-box/LRR-repeat protein [Carex littledalei]|uniref:F-box/LRR-repeat protein n=1 Tax=Carex littledalei TaxID=544730 RepID=A0A833R6M0_9POAL|nr:F-box/LRR-repeat protein [Carex littledalei]